MKKFRIGEIHIDLTDEKNPKFWTYFLGLHAEQGGMQIGIGNLGGDDILSLLDLVGMNIEKNIDEIIEYLIDYRNSK